MLVVFVFLFFCIFSFIVHWFFSHFLLFFVFLFYVYICAYIFCYVYRCASLPFIFILSVFPSVSPSLPCILCLVFAFFLPVPVWFPH